jgi:hypothetical protein
MSGLFLKSKCAEPSRQDAHFGLCDDNDGTKAYSKNVMPTDWIATVENAGRKSVVFTPIDNCIVVQKPGTTDKERTCDGMLTTDNQLYLVELKIWRTGGWIAEAIEQLESTLKLIAAAEDLDRFKLKKAYACNKRKTHFKELDNEQNLRFFREHGFRLDVQGNIKIR